MDDYKNVDTMSKMLDLRLLLHNLFPNLIPELSKILIQYIPIAVYNVAILDIIDGYLIYSPLTYNNLQDAIISMLEKTNTRKNNIYNTQSGEWNFNLNFIEMCRKSIQNSKKPMETFDSEIKYRYALIREIITNSNIQNDSEIVEITLTSSGLKRNNILIPTEVLNYTPLTNFLKQCNQLALLPQKYVDTSDY